MDQVMKSRAAGKVVAWRSLLLATAIPVSIGCTNPPPLSEQKVTTPTGVSLIPRGKTPPTVQSKANDTGVRPGTPGAGGPYLGLGAKEKDLFASALDVFKEVDSVSGTVAEEEGSGLGPTFNGAACAQCHKQPEVGGSSPSPESPQQPEDNPQIALASKDGATNSVPTFIVSGGPIREARFKSDGGVHGLFTIAGRMDATGCNRVQPDFAREDANGNLSFRIPTPIFGLGLVENTADATLEANLATDLMAKQTAGIAGTFQRSGNDGTIMRFGWKAQNKSLLVFAGEAYNVEQGVANELFTNERGVDPGCALNTSPEDHTDNEALGQGGITDMVSDVTSFAIFMRLSAPPTPSVASQGQRGLALFMQVGCNLCHSTDLVSGSSPFTGMSGSLYHPFSDFALHHMGESLSDGIVQGAAGPDQFRTSPLWGVGQRIFFLHDGRTGDLTEAIEYHDSPGSEATTVISRFNALNTTDQQAIVDFLRTL